MKKGISEKSTFRQGEAERRRQAISIGTLALIIAMVLLASYGIIQIVERRAHTAAEKLVSEVVDHIDAKMDEVAVVTEAESLKAYDEINDPDALEDLVRDFVERNDFIYGSTVAFEPDAFPDRGRCFAPYSWKTPDGEVHSRQLGTETDYYEEEWYAETKTSGEEYWCEPYFDEGGAKIMMCTFSVPLKDRSGNLVAVMTADVGLEDLEDYISTINPSPESRIVLSSKKGTGLAGVLPESGSGAGDIIIKGITEIGWSVELMLPFTYLMRGDTGGFLSIGIILLATVLAVYFINRLLQKLQERSSAEYLNVIDAVSSGYSSIYLVNLLTDETVTFRDPADYLEVFRKLGIGNDGFSEKLPKLLNYNCYRQDLDRMLREVDLATIRRNLSSQERYEVRFRKESDSGLNWYEMDVFVMGRGIMGEPVRAVVAFADVNDSVVKELEAQNVLEEALDMAEAANNAKTTFLFNMSHDIRTPMNAIIGFTNMALKHIDDKERVTDSLNKTQQAGELLLSLINDILDMSRIESGKIQLDESACDVYESFTTIESTMSEMAGAKNIDLSFGFGSIEDRYVYADFTRCIRVFINIITNAIKYTPEGGRIKVRCEQDGVQDGRGIYRYTFEDNGIGMSQEFQKRVFEEFTREETATVSGIQGTGLGLAVCKSFVNAMNGTIECSSVQGEGSTFTVTLPFRIQEENFVPVKVRSANGPSSETGQLAGEPDFSGKRILLVEDNELNREIAEDLLSEEGMIVESASDGSVAVNMLIEKGPDYYDFILMDIQMPVMDGYEATGIIRDMYPQAGIPIIALSANAFEEDKVKSIAAGMNGHVAKPVNMEALKSALARHI